MPTYRVTYFPARGRAEPMRQILSLAGQEFEDRRLEGESWQKVKPTTPFGQMPFLEVDGKILGQSNAASRYLARTFGYYGANDWEAAQIDMIMDCMDDIIKPILTMMFNKNDVEKAEQKKKIEEESVPTGFGHLEKLLSSNGKGEYFVGNKISLADIHVIHFITFLKNLTFDLTKFPKVAALQKRVENEPKIKAWIEKRPKTDY